MYIQDLTTNAQYNFPIATALTFNQQVEVTQMPIPLQNIPLLMNFGGGQPSVTVSWMVTGALNSTGTVAGDWILLSGNATGALAGSFQPGASTAGYNLVVPEMGTISIQGFIYTMQLTYVQGEPNTFTGTMTMYAGTII
jgi:hypothetical protein